MTDRACVRSLFLLILVLSTGCAPRVAEEAGVDVRRLQEIKGDSCMELGRYWDALPYYRYAWMLSETAEERAEITAKLYRVFYQAREWDSCIVQAEIIRGTPYFDSLDYKGLAYWRAGRYEEILGICDASPLLCAEAASRMGLSDSARILYARAEELLGDVARGRRAEVYAELEEKDSAIALLEEMSHPSSSQARLLVELLFEDKAWGRLPSAIARLPAESERLAALVMLYDATGDEGKKRRDQMRLLRVAPFSPGARQAAREIEARTASETYAVAMAYRVIDKRKALELFSKAQTQGYRPRSCRGEKARLHYELGEYQQALNLLEGVQTDQARFLKVRIHRRQDEYSQAMKVLERIAEESSSYTNRQEAWEIQATILQQQGKNLEAAQLASQGASVLADEELGHRALILWLAHGDTAKAKDALSGKIPLDEDVSVFYKVWLYPDSANHFLSELEAGNPYSYYLLTARESLPEPVPLDTWFIQLGDTGRVLSSRDSLLQEQAWHLARAGFFSKASAKLGEIDNPPPRKLFEWAERFSDMGADNLGIYWVVKLLRKGWEVDLQTKPREILRLQYPSPYVLKVAAEVDDKALFLSLIRQESWFNPDAKSPANAYGLCQLLYSTAKGLDEDVTVDSLYEPRVSIRLGAEFFRRMRKRFEGRKPAFLAAYNAGPGAVGRWVTYLPSQDVLFIELIPYDETRNYVKRLLAGEVIYRELLEGSDSHIP